jgi:hypothetical protein
MLGAIDALPPTARRRLLLLEQREAFFERNDTRFVSHERLNRRLLLWKVVFPEDGLRPMLRQDPSHQRAIVVIQFQGHRTLSCRA